MIYGFSVIARQVITTKLTFRNAHSSYVYYVVCIVRTVSAYSCTIHNTIYFKDLFREKGEYYQWLLRSAHIAVLFMINRLTYVS